MPDRLLHAAASLALLLAVALLLSTNRRAIRLRTVLPALILQVAIGALVLFVPAGREALRLVSRGVEAVLAYGDQGVAFLFGALVDQKMIDVFGGLGFILALKVLPQIVYVSALIALLYHWRVMQLLTRLIGEGLRRCLGTSRIESFAAVATIFVGQSEIAIAIRPFLPSLTRAELFAVMSGGMAAVAGSILAGYAALGVPVTTSSPPPSWRFPAGSSTPRSSCRRRSRRASSRRRMSSSGTGARRTSSRPSPKARRRASSSPSRSGRC
jgi:CNT family concentrative nucleoside transporter